jgi:hypothetical protein
METGEGRSYERVLACPGDMEFQFNYFAAAGAGVAGVAAVLLTDFLFFFTCFFATGAFVSAGAAAVCAASDNPAVASVKESPNNTAVIFFMMFCPVPFRGSLFFCLCNY